MLVWTILVTQMVVEIVVCVDMVVKKKTVYSTPRTPVSAHLVVAPALPAYERPTRTDADLSFISGGAV